MSLPILEPKPTPEVLHLIWVGSQTPEWVQERWDAWWNRAVADGWTIHLWNDTRVEQLLPRSFALRDMCPHPAIYSDFIRIEAVSAYGGVYMDSDTWPLNPLGPLAGSLEPWVASDAVKRGRPQVTNSAFGSPAGSRLLSRVWDLGVKRLTTRHFDLIHYYAGPVVWAQAAREFSTTVKVMPPEAFTPLPWRARKTGIPRAVADLDAFAAKHPESYALHEFEQSWNKRTHQLHKEDL